MVSPELISKVQSGDRDAFNELYGMYHSLLVSYASLFLPVQWAEDAVQDVFFNVWRNRARLDQTTSLYKYLMRAVYNQSMNYLGKHKHAVRYRSWYEQQIETMSMGYYAPENSPVIDKIYSEELGADIDAAIESLPPKCREVFKLSYLYDMPNREIGERLGISLSTVENHMYIALKQLREKLSKHHLLILLGVLLFR